MRSHRRAARPLDPAQDDYLVFAVAAQLMATAAQAYAMERPWGDEGCGACPVELRRSTT